MSAAAEDTIEPYGGGGLSEAAISREKLVI